MLKRYQKKENEIKSDDNRKRITVEGQQQSWYKKVILKWGRERAKNWKWRNEKHATKRERQ